MTSGNGNRAALAASFVAGVAVSAALCALKNRRKKKERENAGATAEGNSLSLFYGDVSELTTVTESRKFLPNEIYARLVRDCVVCCVDIVLVRTTTNNNNNSNAVDGTYKECLLVERASEPVKGVWWWPGGRLLKGETFFDAAIRKAREETGLTQVKPIQVLGVWNTFFPTSHWDTPTEKGTQTVNPVVLVELLTAQGGDVMLDETSERWRWISLDPNAAMANGEDKYVVEALLRLKEWNSEYSK